LTLHSIKKHLIDVELIELVTNRITMKISIGKKLILIENCNLEGLLKDGKSSDWNLVSGQIKNEDSFNSFLIQLEKFIRNNPIYFTVSIVEQECTLETTKQDEWAKITRELGVDLEMSEKIQDELDKMR